MKDFKTREKFIELRANNESYASIAKKLKVSRPTLIQWAKDHKVEIDNMRTLSLDALQEQYGVSKRERIIMLGEQLQAVRKELLKRGLDSVPTFRLLEMMTRLTDYLIKEETPTVFYKQHEGLRLLDEPREVEEWEG